MSELVTKREPGRNPGRRRHAAGSVRRCAVATRTYLLLAAIVGATCLASVSTAQVRLPDFGDSAEEGLSPAEERVLGEAFMRAVRARLTLVDEPLVEQYVRSLGYRLAASSDRRDLGFTFFVVEDPSLNAFAAPGGFIGVNSGLMTATRSESEFASVLAHEIAHVTQRHIARAIEHGSRSSLPVLAGILAAVIVGAQDVEAGQATAAAVIGSSAQRQINFTRHNELEADRVGIRMLADAGFDPRGMAGVFEKLQNAARYSQHPPEYLSTHPVTTNRIAEARDRAARLPYRQHESSESYYLVRANLRVRTAADAQRVLDQLADEAATGQARSIAANTYGQALAMVRLGREEEARGLLEGLVASDPDNPVFQAALAGNARRMGNLPRALALYEEGLDLYPDDRALVRGRAAALNEAGLPRDTLSLIDDYGRLYTLDAAMYRLRADAYEKLGRTLESRADLAEHLYLSGRPDRAIQQLRLALRDRERSRGEGRARNEESDFYRVARIEARLEELEAERRQRLVRR